MASNGHSVVDELSELSPADILRQRLDDPQTAAALSSLLDHADLLAVIIEGLDGFVRRGDDIATNLTSAIGELKAVNGADTLAQLGSSLAKLSSGMVKATPAISTMLDSPLTDERGAEVLAALGEAVVTARATAPPTPPGVRGIWKTLRTAAKDPDIRRSLSYVLEVVRIFGRKV